MKKIYVVLLASCLSSVALSADVVVIESTSTDYPVGKILDADMNIVLGEDVEIMLIAEDGMIISLAGPYTGPADNEGTPGVRGAGVAALEVVQQSGDQIAVVCAFQEVVVPRQTSTAEALDEALVSMTGSFTLAIVILYLLISALFKSFRDSLLVILTIPMATVGGIISLRIMDVALFGSGGQKMDLLTMIGFVILLGLVVNNAILLVYRARDGEREGMSRRDAVENAVRLRLRPILMSTMTSIFGMLPMMLIPGSGTELYRGMATVIVGGMLVSTLFTLVLLPSLLRANENLYPARQLTAETSLG